MITKLDPKYLICNFNFEAAGAVIVPFGEDNKVIITGNFRSKRDYVGISWMSTDTWSHPDFRYPTSTDFSNVVLSYTYNIEGSAAPLDSVAGSPSLIIVMSNDQQYIIRLWNYVVDRPQDDWEQGGGILFPEGRTPGTATGTSGNIVIDFDNLYAGWRAYDDAFIEGVYTWIPSPTWTKLDPSEIKEIRWGITRRDYNASDPTPLDDSYPFTITFTNWNVDGDVTLGDDPQPLSKHLYRLSDSYDDNYTVTPKRYIEQFSNLGFTKLINLYIGASHFYDKSSDGTPTPGDYVPYKYTLKTTPILNKAFEAWWRDLLKWAKYHEFNEVIASISLENVNIPDDWRQLTVNGEPATAGWQPTPYFASFCNADVISYYKNYVKALADIQDEAGMPVSIQLGEPWWWWKEDLPNKPPCIYDNATRQAHLLELGYDMPEWNTSNINITEYEETLYWLRDKNGNFAHLLRDHLRTYYPNAKFTVLFFPPSVLDEGRVPPMIRIINFPQEYWSNIDSNLNLDFFQIEDYDYILFNELNKHTQIYSFVWNYLNYQFHRTQYFAGFYPDSVIISVIIQNNPLIITEGLWDRINEAAIDAINNEFEAFIWSGTQIRRDGWVPPPIKWKARNSMNL